MSFCKAMIIEQVICFSGVLFVTQLCSPKPGEIESQLWREALSPLVISFVHQSKLHLTS